MSTSSTLKPIDVAISELIKLSQTTLQTESIPLFDANDRVLAQDIVANINVPPEANSAMDGYAVRLRDLTSIPCTLAVTQRIPAGKAAEPLSPTTSARIFTGAPTPSNCDAVVMQENCESSGENVTILQMPSPNENIRAAGNDIIVGQKVFSTGHRIQAQDLGVLASLGFTHIEVYRRVRVATLSTGDELVETGGALSPGQIFNSNTPMLRALLERCNCEVVSQQHVRDELSDTKHALTLAAQKADLVISTGGVSVGEEDHVKTALAMLGEIHFWKVKLKPGKPLAVGMINETLFLGLPGNPVSSFVTFLLFAIPLIRSMQGSVFSSPRTFSLPARFTRSHAGRRPEYLRVRLTKEGIEQYPNQSSGALYSASWADALAFVDEGQTIKAGDTLTVIPFEAFFA